MTIARVGRLVVGAALLASPQARARLALALNVEDMLNQGRALGLSEEESREVFHAWQAAYRTMPDPLDLGKVRRALVLRACGEEWKP